MKQFMEIAGRRMAYLDEGQGPALLFGHSYLWDSAMWAPQIEALKEHYRCIVPELWGHGDSDVLPEGPCTLATLARDHLALLDALGIDECVLVGLSIGGMWGVELARMAPARLKGLVLMDSFVGLEPQITCERYLGMLAMIEQVGAVPAPIADQVAPLFFAHQPDAALMAGFKARLAQWPADKVASLVAVGRSFVTREDRIDWLEEMRLPALVMTTALNACSTAVCSSCARSGPGVADGAGKGFTVGAEFIACMRWGPSIPSLARFALLARLS